MRGNVIRASRNCRGGSPIPEQGRSNWIRKSIRLPAQQRYKAPENICRGDNPAMNLIRLRKTCNCNPFGISRQLTTAWNDNSVTFGNVPKKSEQLPLLVAHQAWTRSAPEAHFETCRSWEFGLAGNHASRIMVKERMTKAIPGYEHGKTQWMRRIEPAHQHSVLRPAHAKALQAI